MPSSFFQPVQEDLQHRGLAGPGPTAEDAEAALVELGERLGLLLPGPFLDFGRQLGAALLAELLLEQLLPTPPGLRRRVLRLRFARGSRLLTSRSSSDEPLQRHRGRIAVHPEVEGFLIEGGLPFDEVPVRSARTPLGEALDDAVEGLGEGEQRVALFGRPLEHGDRHATDSARVVLGADLVGVEEPSGITFGPHPPVDRFPGRSGSDSPSPLSISESR